MLTMRRSGALQSLPAAEDQPALRWKGIDHAGDTVLKMLGARGVG